MGKKTKIVLIIVLSIIFIDVIAYVVTTEQEYSASKTYTVPGHEERTENVTDGKYVELSSGNYVGGQDVNSGTYDVCPISGYDTVRFGIQSFGIGFNQFDEEASKCHSNITISEGDTIKIGTTGMGVTVSLTPVEREEVVEEATEDKQVTEEVVRVDDEDKCYVNNKLKSCSELQYYSDLSEQLDSEID